MKYTILLLLMLIFSVGYSQHDTVYGKPIIRVFSNFHTIFENNKSKSAFEVNRVVNKAKVILSKITYKGEVILK